MRPRLIVELELASIDGLDLRHDRTYLWKGKAWQIEPVGCVLCVDNDENVTLVAWTKDGAETFHCQRHGQLAEVPYRMTKNYLVAIGEVVREGTEETTDSMLLPAALSGAERKQLIESILDEAEQDVVDDGPT